MNLGGISLMEYTMKITYDLVDLSKVLFGFVLNTRPSGHLIWLKSRSDIDHDNMDKEKSAIYGTPIFRIYADFFSRTIFYLNNLSNEENSGNKVLNTLKVMFHIYPMNEFHWIKSEAASNHNKYAVR